jgi:hypothetical protein
MKLPAYIQMRRWQADAARSSQHRIRTGASRPQVVPAQQGIGECQDYCDATHPDSPMEQLECYKQECWS